jgi:hypothetical protein
MTSETTPAGEIKTVTAAINLSSSYLESVFTHTNPGADPPTADQLDKVFATERDRLLPQVARLITPQDERNVAISWHYDVPLMAAQAGPAGTLDQSMDLLRQYGPQSGLAVLALFSLGLMFHLARRGDDGESFGLELGLPAEAIEAAKIAAGDVAAVVGEAAQRRGAVAVGGGGGPGVVDAEATGEVEQAAATEGMLVAQEVEPSTVQTRKMLDQVAEMVAEDPDTVSSLIEQWVQKNESYHEGDL